MRIVGYFFLQLIVTAAVVVAANFSQSMEGVSDVVSLKAATASALEMATASAEKLTKASAVDSNLYNSVGECNSCGVSNYYQCNKLNENCFYFGQTSRCSGCCTSRMELDPFGFLPKEVNQSCCVPVQRVLKQTTLWCYGEADLSKETDPRFPGWYFQNGFQYSVVTQCSCEEPEWQATAVKTSGPILETIKPEESLLTDCMKEIQQPCFTLAVAGQNLQGCTSFTVISFEVCQQSCLALGYNVCAGVEFTTGANFCTLCTPAIIANEGFIPDPDTNFFMRNTACGEAGFPSLTFK